jgi:hypothetical protein
MPRKQKPFGHFLSSLKKSSNRFGRVTEGKKISPCQSILMKDKIIEHASLKSNMLPF